MRGEGRLERNSDGDACVIRKGICVHSISINSSQSGETASTVVVILDQSLLPPSRKEK